MATWEWPVPGFSRISSYFGYRGDIGVQGATKDHKGIDIPAPLGTGIVAIGPGKVINSGPAKGYGQWIRIDHGNGLISIYGHMSQRLVQKDDKVEAGQLIALVGSEGVSSGNHLHFQIELNGIAKNPLSYISNGSVGTAIEVGGISGGSTSFDVTNNYVTEFEGKVYPETIAGISSQPLMPFVEFVVGGQSLTLLPPQYVVDFEFTKSVKDEAHRFRITLFDDNWEEVELLCAGNQENVQLRYGYSTGIQSKFYSGKLLRHVINFTSTGTLLTLEGATSGVVTNLNNMTLNTGTLNPTEAAKEVARAAGWRVLDENFHPSHTVDSSNRDSYALSNERPATYIINKLAPMAIRTSDNKGGYRFYLDETTDPPTAYFRPIDISDNTKRTYIYGKGIDSPVIRLDLAVNQVMGGSSFGESISTGETTTFIDPETGEEIQASEALNSDTDVAVGKYSSTSGEQYTSTIDAAGNSRSEMNAMLRFRLDTSHVPYEGHLTIVGDPSIELLNADETTIRLIILDDFGNPHHTSGLYLVSSIIDTISGGIMQTQMKITRTEDPMVGIEIVNYRKLLK